MRNFKTLGFLLVLLTLPGLALAQETATRVDTTTTYSHEDDHDRPYQFWAQGGGFFFKEDDADDAMFGSARLTYDISPNLAAGVEGGYIMSDVEGGGTKFGELRGIPVLADVILKYPIEATDNRLVPYLLGGVGVVFWDFDEESVVSTSGISIESDAAFAGKVGGGFDVFLTDNFALFVEGAYMFSEYEAEFSGSGLAGATDVETDGAMVGGGLKVAF